MKRATRADETMLNKYKKFHKLPYIKWQPIYSRVIMYINQNISQNERDVISLVESPALSHGVNEGLMGVFRLL